MTVTERDDAPPSEIGWLRAIAVGLGVLVVGLGLTVGGTDAIMKHVTSVNRDTRQWLAIALFLLVIAGVAWTLRRMQARGWI